MNNPELEYFGEILSAVTCELSLKERRDRLVKLIEWIKLVEEGVVEQLPFYDPKYPDNTIMFVLKNLQNIEVISIETAEDPEEAVFRLWIIDTSKTIWHAMVDCDWDRGVYEKIKTIFNLEPIKVCKP